MKKGWQTKTLGEICDIERGGSPRPIQEFITTEPNGINWIMIGDATASGKYTYKTEEKISLTFALFRMLEMPFPVREAFRVAQVVHAYTTRSSGRRIAVSMTSTATSSER